MAQIIIDSSNNLIQGDFDNATVNNRTKFKTTTLNGTTNVYAVPNGSSTSAGYSVSNNADPTNASKITIATNGSTDTQIISGINGSGSYLPLSFYTNNALAMQITTGGIISAVGGGIQFPATAIPSADANTLDDYEEGNWTPAVGGNATYFTVTGQYVKIGRLVVATFDMTINVLGTGSSNVISGLPFAGGGNSQGQPGSVGYFANLAAAANYIALRIDLGGSSINTAVTTGSQTTMSAGAVIFGSSSRLIGSVTYQVS